MVKVSYVHKCNIDNSIRSLTKEINLRITRIIDRTRLFEVWLEENFHRDENHYLVQSDWYAIIYLIFENMNMNNKQVEEKKRNLSIVFGDWFESFQPIGIRGWSLSLVYWRENFFSISRVENIRLWHFIWSFSI